MILPLGDSPNPRGIPLITYGLLLANIAAYVMLTIPLSAAAPNPNDPALAEYVRVVGRHAPEAAPLARLLRQVSAYDLFVFEHGFRPAAPALGDLFASIFLHAGFLHLFGNMLFLWIYGDNVEHRLGAVPFLLAYLGTGVAATLFHTAFDLDSELPLVGASGAISGVLGFYFRWFPRNRVRLLVVLVPLFMNVIMVPARIVLGFYLLLDNLLPFLITRGMEGGGVAYGAHIGGFLAGLGASYFLDRRELRARPAEFARVRAAPEPDRSPAAFIREALASGDMSEAARMYFALDPRQTRGLLSAEDSLALGEWLRRNGHGKAALAVFRRHLRDYPGGPGVAEAHLGAGLVQLELLGEPTPAYQHLLDAIELDPSPSTAGRARAALEAIARMQKLQIRPRR